MIVAAIIGATSRIALAQSCAMCYQNAAASGTRGRVALQHGILVLAIPAVVIFGSLLFLLYSRRNVNGGALQGHRSDLEILPAESAQQVKADCVVVE
jgi:hypothetical protein